MGQFRTREQEGNMQYTLLAILGLVVCVSGQRSGRQEAVPVYDQYQGAASDDAGALVSDDPLAGLTNNIPGVPGEDYPIYSEVPETAFACDGQVDGGYYADSEAECQVFHIRTADGAGGLAKYSFLCPNGTLFNQNYFVCDWWFNFDCSTAEELYSLNDEIAAEREALAGAASDEGLGSYEAPADYAAASAPAGDYSVEGRQGRRIGSSRNNRRGGGRSQGRRG